MGAGLSILYDKYSTFNFNLNKLENNMIIQRTSSLLFIFYFDACVIYC